MMQQVVVGALLFASVVFAGRFPFRRGGCDGMTLRAAGLEAHFRLPGMIDMTHGTTPTLTLAYGGKVVDCGAELEQTRTLEKPTLHVGGWPEQDNFTVIMFDIDAPSPSDPQVGQWLHWIVADVPLLEDGSLDIAAGTELISYQPPSPPRGIHRYFTVLVRRRPDIKEDQNRLYEGSEYIPEARSKFNAEAWAEDALLFARATAGAVFFVDSGNPE